MQLNIETDELADITRIGQTGVLDSDGLYALGCLMESIRPRVAMIANYRKNGVESKWDDYEADEETVTVTSSGFEVRMEHYDRCDRRSFYENGYVSFTDFLDNDIVAKIDTEKNAAAEKRRVEEAARMAEATRKNKEAADERAAFERFKAQEKANAKG